MTTLVNTLKNSTYVDGDQDVLTEFWMKQWLFDMDLYRTIGLDGSLDMDNLRSVRTPCFLAYMTVCNASYII